MGFEVAYLSELGKFDGLKSEVSDGYGSHALFLYCSQPRSLLLTLAGGRKIQLEVAPDTNKGFFMRTTKDNRTGFHSGMISKLLGFPLVGLLLMALCLSLAACGDDDDEIVEQGIDPYGTYVGTYQSISKAATPGTGGSFEMDPAPAHLLITKGLSQTKFLLLDDKGNVISNKTIEHLYTEKMKNFSVEFESTDGNSTWKVFSDGTNVKFETYDKTQENGVTTETTITFEGKKQE